ncbi:hypothetical protein AB0958_19110 [Streptomyces sp. NPDC006655]|uniref:hypothetical protein n=1 Tax=Streptomyces sp. NPDC006655 TaxID=3156898 RepID=UPI00345648B3
MPANAARRPDEGDLASVVPLDRQRSLRKALSAPAAATGDADPLLAEAARKYWTQVFAGAGLDLAAPHVSTITSVLVEHLDRIVLGFRSVREGQGDRPPNPEAGLDETGAIEMRGALRDLMSAVDGARAERG